MKYFLLLLLLPLCSKSFAQKADTVWLNTNLEKSDKQSAAFYRVIYTNRDKSFFVQEFFRSGEIQMAGSFSSLEPEVKNGYFTWWYKNGAKKMEAVFKNDTAQTYKEYDADGNIKRQKALAKLVSYVDGKPTFTETAVDALPEFPGEKNSFAYFLMRNLRYPELARRKRAQGKVVVEFIVDQDGKIKEPKIVESADPDLAQEALRVVQLSPNWTPAMLNGKPVSVVHQMPVVFQLPR